MIQNRLVFNFFGVPLNVSAIGFNLGAWLTHQNVNQILTIIISLLAISWWLMKIYDQYISTKIKKEEILKENNKKNENGLSA
jgi:hypothetical protein